MALLESRHHVLNQLVSHDKLDLPFLHLLNHTAAKDLEITSRNLEEAFVALTADDATVTEGVLV